MTGGLVRRGLSSLRVRLTALFALLLAAIAAFIFSFFPARMEAQARRAARHRGVAIARVVAAAAAPALDFNDAINARQLLDWLASTPEATWAALDRDDGTRLAAWRPDRIPARIPAPSGGAVEVDDRSMVVAVPVRGLAGTTGRLALGFSLADLQTEKHDARVAVGLATGGVFVVGLLLSALLGTVLTAPIRRVTRAALAIAHGRDAAEAALSVRGHGEVGTMSRALELMLRRLREQQTILASQGEASIEGILIASLARQVISHNRRFLRLWLAEGTPLADLDAVRELAATRAADPAAARALFAGDGARESSGELRLADGRTLAYYVAPVTSASGERFGTGFYFRDVTREERDAAELREVHARLVDASRRAGMAEVATGVLHNVGNVLNSINVSATLARETLTALRVPAVTRAGELLAELAGEHARGVANHARASRLSLYLVELGRVLDGERARALAELDGLGKNVDHVKNIVSLQNAYAKGGGVTELASLSDVVSDALQVHAQALARHDVAVVRAIAPLPPCSLDRHRVLQILLNLVVNAKHAMAENDGPKELHVTVDRPRPDCARVMVSDNGVGIAPENMARIFSTGFSTRKDGHGFGLHTSALAAQEMGGTLTCRSDGPGHGASFILELPFHAQEKA